MIERSESGTVITGDDILVYRVLAVRQGLILKIDTGLSVARVSSLSVAQRSGLTSSRTCRGALRDVNRWLSRSGVDERWSKKYPNG